MIAGRLADRRETKSVAKKYTVAELIEAFGNLQVKDLRWVLHQIRWMMGDDPHFDGAGVPLVPVKPTLSGRGQSWHQIEDDECRRRLQ